MRSRVKSAAKETLKLQQEDYSISAQASFLYSGFQTTLNIVFYVLLIL